MNTPIAGGYNAAQMPNNVAFGGHFRTFEIIKEGKQIITSTSELVKENNSTYTRTMTRIEREKYTGRYLDEPNKPDVTGDTYEKIIHDTIKHSGECAPGSTIRKVPQGFPREISEDIEQHTVYFTHPGEQFYYKDLIEKDPSYIVYAPGAQMRSPEPRTLGGKIIKGITDMLFG